VEVHCDEEVAIHIGPEPCVYARESMGEASGERIGRPLSRERIRTRMPTSFTERKARRPVHVIASTRKAGQRVGRITPSAQSALRRVVPRPSPVTPVLYFLHVGQFTSDLQKVVSSPK